LEDDGWFVEATRATRGVWIPRDSIVSLEFYDEAWDETETAPDEPAT
jgi:hypothetical protein